MAGGVALNCVANGKMLRDGHFENVWIQPASGDAGGALGAALAALLSVPQAAAARQLTRRRHARRLPGPEFSQDEIEQRLRAAGARFHTLVR